MPRNYVKKGYRPHHEKPFVKRVMGQTIETSTLRHCGVAFDTEMLEEINDYAEKINRTFSEAVRTLIQYGLDSLEEDTMI